MDFDLFIREPEKKVKSIVRKITHSGESDLDKDDLLELKKICKVSKDDLMIVVYKECLKSLRKEHSQVRGSAVRLIDYLFKKSHIIRQKLLDDFDVFLELTLAISQRPKIKLKLPPPKKFAALLQEITTKTIHIWHAEFAEGYEKLRYAYRFLREHQLVDFNQFQVNTHEKRLKQQKLAEQQEKILTRTIDRKLEEYRELKPDIEQLLAQIESLIDILIPQDSNNHDLSGADLTIEHQSDTDRQHHGIPTLSQKIRIEFSPFLEVTKNVDNEEVVQNLRELKKELIDGKLIKLIAIEKTLSKRSEQFLRLIKEIIDLKGRSMNVVLKLGELKIVNEPNDENGEKKSRTLDAIDSDSEDQDDFQDVEPKEGLESYIPKSLRYEYGLEPIDPREIETRNKIRLIDESFSSTELPGTSTQNLQNGNEVVMSCNVKLESGKLCPRRDKIKCPFHGKIVPRDHNGVPLDEELRSEEEKRAKRKSDVPDWQDPKLLSEIKAAIGIDLTMPAKGKRNKQSPNKSIVNPKTCDQTPKQRLQKKLRQLSR